MKEQSDFSKLVQAERQALYTLDTQDWNNGEGAAYIMAGNDCLECLLNKHDIRAAMRNYPKLEKQLAKLLGRPAYRFMTV